MVIGAGIAGVHAASLLADSFDVTLLNAEPYLPYYRMRIGEVMEGKDPSALYMHPEDWYSGKGISLLSGKALSIDTEAWKVKLESGEIGYDKLLIAAGAKARVLPIPSDQEMLTLRCMEDALRMRERLGSAKSLAVIGGGLLGLEAAASAHSAFGIDVTVVETAEYILPNQLDRESSEILRKMIEDTGIRILTGRKAISAENGILHLDDGDVKADAICVSAGVVPDISFRSALACGRGIIVNEYLETSAEGVYSAGDIAELDGRTYGLALYAREMASAAVRSMKGERVPYVPSSPSAQLKVAGIDLFSAGSRDGERVELEGGAAFVKDGIVSGVVSIGNRALALKAKSMIGNRLNR